jgi:hypothetical protein
MSLLKTVPALAVRATTAVSAFIAGRLVQLGLLEDELPNVVDFDGQADQTLSAH